jgi:hypothetical protein
MHIVYYKCILYTINKRESESERERERIGERERERLNERMI